MNNKLNSINQPTSLRAGIEIVSKRLTLNELVPSKTTITKVIIAKEISKTSVKNRVIYPKRFRKLNKTPESKSKNKLEILIFLAIAVTTRPITKRSAILIKALIADSTPMIHFIERSIYKTLL
jgi:hypothetical protein